jgi:hypothetical protein
MYGGGDYDEKRGTAEGTERMQEGGVGGKRDDIEADSSRSTVGGVGVGREEAGDAVEDVGSACATREGKRGERTGSAPLPI